MSTFQMAPEMLIVFGPSFQEPVETRQRKHTETFPMPESLGATWGGAGFCPCGFIMHSPSPSLHSDTAPDKEHAYCPSTNG